MIVHLKSLLMFLFSFLLGLGACAFSQNSGTPTIRINNAEYALYPQKLDILPEIPSPCMTDDGSEVLIIELKNGSFALVLVTIENGDPLVYSTRIDDLFGKDKQLQVDAGDFPSLARTGLHSEAELDSREMITGFPVPMITYIGKPGRFSHAGFMAEDEDIISVLKGDNRLVRQLGLTHPQMAGPLFHVWNIILKEIETGNWERFWDNISGILYKDHMIRLSAESGKGWQISIFQDEIKGRFNINVYRELTDDEKIILNRNYAHLNDSQRMEMENALSHLHFSEMAPYYIMRYGFYEGHTDWRADPLAIAFIFGLRSLQEIEDHFPGELDRVLTRHFTGDNTR